MTYKNPFRNIKFDKKINSVKNEIESYLSEKGLKLNELTDLTIDKLIQWSDVPTGKKRHVYPHEECPEEIKNIVLKFIKEEFKD